ncbi:hypothetical protein [Sphingomonas sp.]|uniref:hypothetical protein n=1 Tax=Sphingomonas sp. TaxID=28214 RepID=UPI0025E92B40|nr:hypothetical protein [Sphingomonas sp.]
MMPVTLKPDARRRVAASARLLLSDKPGEVAAAIYAIGRLLPKGVTVSDLIERSLSGEADLAPPSSTPSPVNLDPAWRRRARMARYSPHLDSREVAFLDDIICWKTLSARQESWLKAIFSKSQGPLT